METIKPRIFKGTRDFLPEEMVRRESIVGTIKGAFRRYGFQPLETPAMEYLDILLGKYGEEGDKLIYRLAYDDGSTLALRYDLTVPLSRLIAMYRGRLVMPFKRYQVQPVWRADRPQIRQGRFREFYQCDADTVGCASVAADAEIVAMTEDILSKLGFERFVIRVNHRGLLQALIRFAGVREGGEAQACRIIDKLDKIGYDGVRKELLDEGFGGPTVDGLFEVLRLAEGRAETETLRELRALLARIEGAGKALDETEELIRTIPLLGTKREHYRLDLYLARGLDYYTGPIYESVLPDHPHIGSLTGGGRYDELIGLYCGVDVPATGTTIGLDRIFATMEQLGMLGAARGTTRVLVVNFGGAAAAAALRLAARLREAGVPTEYYLEPDKLKKQFSYADRKGIPFVALIGEEEAAAGSVSLKEMAGGNQETVTIEEAVRRLAQASS